MPPDIPRFTIYPPEALPHRSRVAGGAMEPGTLRLRGAMEMLSTPGWIERNLVKRPAVLDGSLWEEWNGGAARGCTIPPYPAGKSPRE